MGCGKFPYAIAGKTANSIKSDGVRQSAAAGQVPHPASGDTCTMSSGSMVREILSDHRMQSSEKMGQA